MKFTDIVCTTIKRLADTGFSVEAESLQTSIYDISTIVAQSSNSQGLARLLNVFKLFSRRQ